MDNITAVTSASGGVCLDVPTDEVPFLLPVTASERRIYSARAGGVWGETVSPRAGRSPHEEDEKLACWPEEEDRFIMASGGVGLAIGGAILSYFKDKAVGLATGLANRALGPVMQRGERRLSVMFPPPLTAREKIIYETLYDMDNFSGGVDTLIAEIPDMSPQEAISYAFKFLYLYDPKNIMAKANPAPYLVSAEDITRISQRHKLPVIQVYNLARVVHEEFGVSSKEGLWNNIFQALFDAQHGRSDGRPQEVRNWMTDSQQFFLKEMQAERLILEMDAIKSLLREIGGVLKTTPISSSKGVSTVSLGEHKIELDPVKLLGRSLGRIALAQFVEGVVGKIDAGVSLTPAEESFILALKKHNPVVQKIVDARTNTADVAIRGTNLAVSMAERLQLGEERWFARVIQEVQGCDKPVRTGVIVLDQAGNDAARYEFGINLPRFGGNDRVALYVEGEPYPVSPYSFGASDVIVVKGGEVTVERSIEVTDGRGKKFYITSSEMEKFRGLAREVTADKALLRSEVGRAFLRFFNSMQAVGVMTLGDSFNIEAGSPKEKISSVAKNLARENWAAEFEQELDRLARRFSGRKQMVSQAGLRHAEVASATQAGLRHAEVASATQAGIEDEAERQIAELRLKYIKKFSTQHRSEFKRLMQKLVRGASLEEIRALLARQIGERQSAKLSPALYKEVSAWRKVDGMAHCVKRELPDDLRDVIVMRGVDKSLPPMITRAREYVENGSERAFLEYNRIIADDDFPKSEKMLAAAEKARFAAERMQFPRAKRAVGWIKWKEAIGWPMTQEVRDILERLPTFENGSKVKMKAVAGNTDRAPAVIPGVIDTTVVTDATFFRPRPVRYAIRGYKATRDFTYDIGAPAVVGAATFLGSRYVVNWVLGDPETHLEAVMQGYGTVALATSVDYGIQRGVSYFVSRGVNSSRPMPFGTFTVPNFLGGMGASMFVYRGIEGVASDIGASRETSEVAGLVGTGISYGAWRPVVNRIFNPANAAMIIKTGENMLAKGGLAYFIIDGIPTLAEGIYNIFDDPISVRARDEWYEARKAYYYDRSLLGDEKGVPWYERTWNVLEHVAGYFVPASLQKAVGALNKSF